MKFIIILFLASISLGASAQSFFKPLPKIQHGFSGFAAPKDSSINVFRPIVGVTASVSNGTQLAGGFGVSFQHDTYDLASDTWVIKYSVSALGFLGTNGNKVTGTAGLVAGIPGTAGLIQIGPGYDFTNKQLVLLTGVGINF